ncbi:MAG: HAMP domain-containing protein [Candidatus Hydrogenedentes bacterium]|nr:HAMP domain-containing protein [Candidatus Hydrogenedentota bacterium]
MIVTRIWERILSVPIYVKILGIGILVTFLFGAVSYYGIRASMYRTHYGIHAETVLSIARSLSSRVGKLIETGDAAAITEEIALVIRTFPDVRYVIIQGKDEQVLGHEFTFPTNIPADLMLKQDALCASCHTNPEAGELRSDLYAVPSEIVVPDARFQLWSRPGGLILEVATPVPSGGTVRVGAGDTIIQREITAVSQSLLFSLGVCLVIGQTLAFGLAYAIVRPIQNLLQATNRLRTADFDTRARVYSDDEIGRLAQAFNLLAGELRTYRREVEEKEKVRVSLIERIVRVQEEERKSVARELHDQLGQSLSSVLLSVQGLRRDGVLPEDRYSRVEDEVRGLIDQVRRLAWDIRPSVLDDYGLDSALQRFVEDVSKRIGIPFDYQSVYPVELERLPNHIEVTLYRVAQEAIMNIVRHAEAHRASVVLFRHSHEIILIVEDDGRGFEAGLVFRDKDAALGLLGMKERVELIRGELTIESEVGKGSAVRIKIPLTGEL